jgi:four helix bundle protein
MKRSKHQDPKTKETPNSKLQRTTVVYGRLEVDGASSPSVSWILNDGIDSGIKRLHPFDLEERTAKFGEQIIRLVQSPENNRLVDQLVGAGTSIGANYCEANDCVSRKDFKFTIKRCIKEAKETRFFLRMVAASEPPLADEARELYREATELIRIFASMHRK